MFGLAFMTLAQVGGGEGAGVGTLVAVLALLGVLGFIGVKVLKKVWSKGPEPLEDRSVERAPEPALPAEEEEVAETPLESSADEGPAPGTLHTGLARTRKEGFIARLRRVLAHDLDPNVVDELEEILLTSDIGVHTAQKLFEDIKDRLGRKELSDGEAALAALQAHTRSIFEAIEPPAAISSKPRVSLMVGVNGAGKTTTLGKLASKYSAGGEKVLMVAGDTFRAAAVDQLRVWSERTGAGFHSGAEEADPASVVFDGIKLAEEGGFDVVLCDTAGRLHTHVNLVEELKKVIRVADKALEGAPHEILLVLDATIGQNALHQARTFTDALGVTGLVLTKLDGTARGGAVLGIVDELRLPIRYVGVGEGVEDLRPFDSDAFVAGLFARD